MLQRVGQALKFKRASLTCRDVQVRQVDTKVLAALPELADGTVFDKLDGVVVVLNGLLKLHVFRVDGLGLGAGFRVLVLIPPKDVVLTFVLFG